MSGFRSLGEQEDVEFECHLTERGLEATRVSGRQGIIINENNLIIKNLIIKLKILLKVRIVMAAHFVLEPKNVIVVFVVIIVENLLIISLRNVIWDLSLNVAICVNKMIIYLLIVPQNRYNN